MSDISDSFFLYVPMCLFLDSTFCETKFQVINTTLIPSFEWYLWFILPMFFIFILKLKTSSKNFVWQKREKEWKILIKRFTSNRNIGLPWNWHDPVMAEKVLFRISEEIFFLQLTFPFFFNYSKTYFVEKKNIMI